MGLPQAYPTLIESISVVKNNHNPIFIVEEPNISPFLFEQESLLGTNYENSIWRDHTVPLALPHLQIASTGNNETRNWPQSNYTCEKHIVLSLYLYKAPGYDIPCFEGGSVDRYLIHNLRHWAERQRERLLRVAETCEKMNLMKSWTSCGAIYELYFFYTGSSLESAKNELEAGGINLNVPWITLREEEF